MCVRGCEWMLVSVGMRESDEVLSTVRDGGGGGGDGGVGGDG